ncbi:MAG: hypothetical protein NT094_04520 [Candidatus Staskawiczbacteria bacterium]|nr:hypothetical protein [Candidatus Staskawiczbacteria bacterium]
MAAGVHFSALTAKSFKMIYFIYGQDSFRSKRKLEEIILGYKKIHKSGLNLIYFNVGPASAKGYGEASFKYFYSNLKINSMFAEKKLIILRNVFFDLKFCEEFLENIKSLEDSKDIVVVYEDTLPDQRTKFFKALQKNVKCQEFECLSPIQLKKWVAQEFGNNKAKINLDALDLLIEFVKNDLWQMTNEINKLSNYRKFTPLNSAEGGQAKSNLTGGVVVKKEDVELLVKPNIDNDIFKTIDALASRNKKLALSLLHKHLDNGDNVLYLLSMITYQFRNLLVIKELQSTQPYGQIAKKSGLHPFVVQKSFSLCNQFSVEQLKKIYLKIFQVDSDIKTGKIEPELALDLLLAEI